MKIINLILLMGVSIWINVNSSIQNTCNIPEATDTNIESLVLVQDFAMVNKSSVQIDKKKSIKISELVNNKDKYGGKEVQITGKCTKINANIMGRNWIHLKDGSMDEFDLVITSDAIVSEGETVTMSGVVVLDKDFGAGYKYELIIELGKVVPTKD